MSKICMGCGASYEQLDDEYYVQEKTESDEIYSKENNYGWEPVGGKFRIQIDEDLDIADKILDEASKSLTSVQKDKLNSLMESVTFTNEKDYSDKIERFKAVIEVGSTTFKVEESKVDGKKPSWKK